MLAEPSPVAGIIIRLAYLICAIIGVALFLFARRFKTGLRSLLQALGACIIALSLFFFVFVPDQHEYEVLMFDFVGAPLTVLFPLAAAMGALWAARRSGCLAIALASIVGMVLGELFALAWIGEVLLNGSPNDERLRMVEPIYLGLLAVILLSWTILGIVQQKRA